MIFGGGGGGTAACLQPAPPCRSKAGRRAPARPAQSGARRRRARRGDGGAEGLSGPTPQGAASAASSGLGEGADDSRLRRNRAARERGPRCHWDHRRAGPPVSRVLRTDPARTGRPPSCCASALPVPSPEGRRGVAGLSGASAVLAAVAAAARPAFASRVPAVAAAGAAGRRSRMPIPCSRRRAARLLKRVTTKSPASGATAEESHD